MSRFACSWLVLLMTCSASVSAPAPLPRPKGPPERAAFAHLERELREGGFSVIEVIPAGATAWEVKYTTARAPCLVGVRGKVFSTRIKARDRDEALATILRRCREEDEETTRRLRADGVIP